MKQTLRFALGFLCSVVISTFASAQAGDYSLTVTTGMFTPLGASATNVSAIEDDDQTAIVPIGFNFVFDGATFDTVKVSSNGFMSFNQSASSNAGNNLDGISAANRPLVAPLWDDLDGRAPGSVSKASYEVTGTAPNRVFTFEWLNWEWRFNSSDTNVSFQVKLYETTNVVEFTYRNEANTPSTPSASIGLTGTTTFLSVSGIGTGSVTTSNATETSNIDTVVTDQILRFTPPACPSPGGISFTNVTADSLTINWNGSGSGPWYINWGPTGFTQGSPTSNYDTTTTGTLRVGGLISATQYDFYIREVCPPNAVSNWAGPFTQRTIYKPPYLGAF